KRTVRAGSSRCAAPHSGTFWRHLHFSSELLSTEVGRKWRTPQSLGPSGAESKRGGRGSSVRFLCATSLSTAGVFLTRATLRPRRGIGQERNVPIRYAENRNQERPFETSEFSG